MILTVVAYQDGSQRALCVIFRQEFDRGTDEELTRSKATLQKELNRFIQLSLLEVQSSLKDKFSLQIFMLQVLAKKLVPSLDRSHSPRPH